jgi:RNA-directed DNA polymerase
MSEKPVHSRRRKLVDWINLTDAKKVHSLIDKVYKRKNLEMAWEKVKENRGSGGVDGQTLEAFEAQLDQQLDRLQRELKEDTYQPLPVRQHRIPKRDKPGEYRMLGIPTVNADCTGPQFGFGMGGDLSSVSPTSRPAL